MLSAMMTAYPPPIRNSPWKRPLRPSVHGAGRRTGFLPEAFRQRRQCPTAANHSDEIFLMDGKILRKAPGCANTGSKSRKTELLKKIICTEVPYEMTCRSMLLLYAVTDRAWTGKNTIAAGGGSPGEAAPPVSSFWKRSCRRKNSGRKPWL